jgi:hypothetical protein
MRVVVVAVTQDWLRPANVSAMHSSRLGVAAFPRVAAAPPQLPTVNPLSFARERLNRNRSTDFGSWTAGHESWRVSISMTAMRTAEIRYRSEFYLLSFFGRWCFAERNGFSAFCAINCEIPFPGLNETRHKR